MIFLGRDIGEQRNYSEQVAREIDKEVNRIVAEAYDQAKDILTRLGNGEDFCKLATELSTDTGSKVQCGELGWFGKGKMVADFETAAFSLEVGQL
ncbi:MAG: peptidylprolyl isomerase, partial [Syntrophobacteraceae bacterium]|nr:peptidylprolyl isomerase [Syntrophobacteraceae bacterium]